MNAQPSLDPDAQVADVVIEGANHISEIGSEPHQRA